MTNQSIITYCLRKILLIAKRIATELSDCVCIIDHTCYTDIGDNYRGTASRTVSGLECGYWSHQIFLRTADYPELTGGHNYCRNPGNMESRPWCFVHDQEVRKEFCDIPECCESCFWFVPCHCSQCISQSI